MPPEQAIFGGIQEQLSAASLFRHQGCRRNGNREIQTNFVAYALAGCCRLDEHAIAQVAMTQFPEIKPSRLTLEEIKTGFELMLSRSLSLRSNQETLLVIFDETFRPYVEGFSQVIVERDIKADFKFLPLLYQQHLTRKLKTEGLPESLRLSFDEPSAVLCLLSGWVEGQPLRRDIVDYLRRNANRRLAHVPGFSDDILQIVAQTDFDAVVEDCELMAWVLCRDRYRQPGYPRHPVHHQRPQFRHKGRGRAPLHRWPGESAA